MKPDLQILDSSRDRSHGWKRFESYLFAAGESAAPLLLAELPAVISLYPIAFARLAEDRYQLVALTGLHPRENLYIDGRGRWSFGYVPSVYRGYPFVLQRVEIDGKPRGVVAFNRASDLYREEPDPQQGEERFFDEEGRLQPLMQRILEFLKQSADSRVITQRAVDALVEADLFEAWNFPIENPDPERPFVKGVYRIKEKALQALGGNTLEKLHRAHALPMAHAQLLSTPRLGVLSQLYARRQAVAQKASQDKNLNFLESLFQDDEDDLFKFD